MAVSSMRASRWRTVFTMLGIIIGVTSVVTIVSLGEGLKQQINGQISQLGNNVISVRPGKLLTNNGGIGNINLYAFLAPSTLTAKDVNSLQNLPGVDNVAPIEFVTNAASADGHELDSVFVAGTDSSLAAIVHQQVQYGSFFSDDNQDSPQNFAVIGSSIAANLFGELNPVGETVHIMGQDFVVQGVLAPSSGGLLSVAQADYNSSIYIPATAAAQLTDGHTNILQILAQTKPGANVNSAVQAIKKTIGKNHGNNGDFTVLKQDQLLGVTNQVLNTVTTFISSIAAISLLVGGIGIMDIMLVSISERTREIGIRKAIGATNRQVLNQFLIEGLVLTVSGGLIGVAISVIINQLLRLYTSWKPIISIPILLLAVGISVATGIIFSIAPALKAARKDPIDALRGE